VRINSLQIEVDVYCQWIDECERLEAAKRVQEMGNGLGLIKAENMVTGK
jgi:transcription elongation factor Elf1